MGAPVCLDYLAWQCFLYDPTAVVCGTVLVCVHEQKPKAKIIFKAVSSVSCRLMLPTAFSFPLEEREAAAE